MPLPLCAISGSRETPVALPLCAISGSRDAGGEAVHSINSGHAPGMRSYRWGLANRMFQRYGSHRMRLGAVVGFYAGNALPSASITNRSVIEHSGRVIILNWLVKP